MKQAGFLILLVLVWVSAGVLAAHIFATPAPELPVFTDVTEQAGIRFQHSFGDYSLTNIVEGTGSGACVFDYNNDGSMDVYFVNGRWNKSVNDNRGRDLQGKLSNALYRNNGDGTFTDVAKETGLEGKGYGVGCSAADFDNDGNVDLLVLNYGPNEFYRNNGNGTFTDISEKSGLNDAHWSVSAPWLDYNGDGLLDVYVGNYLEYDDGKFRAYYAAAGYPGPLSYSGQADALYRNNGDGTFTNVTKEAGVFFPGGRAMSATAADLNGDGLPDLYVANDAMENYYFENAGKGAFKERAMALGIAFGEHGQGVSSMGPVFGDIDRNGLLDLFVPDMGYGSLMMNFGKFFEDRTTASGLAPIIGQYTGWGAVLLDYDNDGYLDLFVANGDAHHEYTEESVLVRNDGKGNFADVAAQSGPYFQQKFVSRGAAWMDFDNDGDIDLVVVNLNGQARLLRNDGGNKTGNWLKIAPKIHGGKVAAVGARITVTAGDLRQIEDVYAVRGYLSQGDWRANFGLGQAPRADSVEIRWPNGQVQRWKNVKANQVFSPVQGK